MSIMEARLLAGRPVAARMVALVAVPLLVLPEGIALEVDVAGKKLWAAHFGAPIALEEGSYLAAKYPNHAKPIFAKGVPVAVHMVFSVKRPNDDFVGKKRFVGRLVGQLKGGKEKELARGDLKGDIDNFAKLVLDALKGLLFEDDRQVVYTTALKLPDTTGSCEGSVSIKARPITSAEMKSLWLSESGTVGRRV